MPRYHQMPLDFTHLTASGPAGLCLDRSTKVKFVASPFTNHIDMATVNTGNKTVSHKLAPSPFLVLIIPYPILNLLPAKHFFYSCEKRELAYFKSDYTIMMCFIFQFATSLPALGTTITSLKETLPGLER